MKTTNEEYINKRLFQRMFGIYLRESRESLGMSLKHLRNVTSIPVYRLEQIEAGQIAFRKSTLRILMAALNLQESRIERLLQVARVDFIDNLMKTIWTQHDPEDSGCPTSSIL